jgi:hypothetical protein
MNKESKFKHESNTMTLNRCNAFTQPGLLKLMKKTVNWNLPETSFFTRRTKLLKLKKPSSQYGIVYSIGDLDDTANSK